MMSDMTEIECFEQFSEGVKRAAAGARAIFTHRRDQGGWIQIAHLLDKVLDQAQSLENARKHPPLILS